jgi:thioredoxin-related protein/DNA-directed RNA polymerase subunit F
LTWLRLKVLFDDIIYRGKEKFVRILRVGTFAFACLIAAAAIAQEVVAIKWEVSLEKAFERAKNENRLVLASFTKKTGSQGCDTLRSETYQDAKVIQFVGEKFVAVEVYVDNPSNRPQFEKYGVSGLQVPVVIVLTGDGTEVGRFTGFRPPADFIEAVTEIVDADKNISDADAALQKDPNDAIAHLKKGKALLAKGKGEGRASVEKAAELDSKNEKGAGALAYYKLAELALSSRNREEAKKHLEKVVEIDAKNICGKTAHALFLLGQFAWEAKDGGKAAEYFKKAKEVDPEDKAGLRDDIEYIEAKAPLLETDRRQLEAAENLVKFAQSHPKSNLAAHALYEAANFYYTQKNLEKAIALLEQIVKEYPQAQVAKGAQVGLEQLRKQVAPKEEPKKQP